MPDRIYIVFAPPFDPLIGGVVALHKLCDVLNRMGQKCFLFPYVTGLQIDMPLVDQLGLGLTVPNANISHLQVNPNFVTPVLSLENLSVIKQSNHFVVIYPEIVWGNPLGAKNVVRWFLHNPGHFTRKVYYGTDELYFRFGPEAKPAIIPGSKLSDVILEVTHFPFEHYNEHGWAKHRSGTAYCLRKGRNKPIVHDTSDSILIDGKPHEEVAAIFKKVTQFIAYDSRTSFSKLAVLCGCESVVIPDANVSEQDWAPDPSTWAGVAYGFENLPKARDSAHLVPAYYRGREEAAACSVREFLKEVSAFFV